MAMRTTLTLDDDFAEALNRTARLSGRSFKTVVNEASRRSLKPGPSTLSPTDQAVRRRTPCPG
jgi:Arc/MetJ family transcription regulator